MSQLVQVRGGVEFWRCLNCGSIRRIFPSGISTIFLVPPEFCSAKCQREYMRSEKRLEFELRGQMSFADILDHAVNE